MNVKLSRLFLPLAVLAAFVVIAAVVVRTAPEPEPEPREELGALVEVAAVERGLHRIDVEAQGTVIPARQVTVQPQVSGRVEWVSDRLVPGGTFGQGQHLFRIERADYELAVETARSALSEAEAQLALERGRGRVAEREWELFRDELDDEQREAALALREPQLRAAEAAVAAARARLARAELDLERTVVASPWDSLVLSESIEVGQTVGPQTLAATLVGTDTFWVRAAVPTERLSAISIPGVGGAAPPSASAAEIGAQGGDAVVEGRVVRLLGDVDPAGRMARVLIEVPSPLTSEGSQRLLLNSFVDLTIEGESERALFALPRDWLQDGREVWLFDDGRLEVRSVDVVWRGEETVYVDQGLEDGDQVVTSRIATPVPGMKLRRLGDLAAPPSRDGAPLQIETEATPGQTSPETPARATGVAGETP